MKKSLMLFLAMGFVALVCLYSCEKGKKAPTQQVQNFSLIDVVPNYTADEVQFDVKVFFTMPVEEEEAVKEPPKKRQKRKAK